MNQAQDKYYVKNKSTGVNEIETTILVEAILSAKNYEEILDEIEAADLKDKAGIASVHSIN